MLLFKLGLFSLASLFFAGNITANCIDLTGTYKCPHGAVTFLQGVNKQGVFTYITLINDEVTAFIANGEFDFFGQQKVTCDEKQVKLEIPLLSYVEEYHLSDDKTKLVLTAYSTEESQKQEHIESLSCERIQP